MICVVLDANVVVSAYLNPHGKPARILSIARQNIIELCFSPQIILEIAETLIEPRLVKLHGDNKEDVLAFSRALADVAIITPGIFEVNVVAADPDDNKILACAVEGKADFIVSGDHHLTDLVSFEGISIVNPDNFLRLMRKTQ